MKAMIFTSMPMFTCLFWSVILGIEQISSGSKRPRTHLLVFMLTATLLYVGHCAFFNHDMGIIPLTDTIYCFCNLAVYPLYYLYIASMTIQHGQNRERWLILLPSLLFGATVGILYLLMSQEETRQFINDYLYHNHHSYGSKLVKGQILVHDMCKVMFALLIIPVVVYGSKHIREFNRQVAGNYSDTEGKTLESVQYLLYAFLLTSVISFVFNIIGRYNFDSSKELLAIPSVIFSILLFAIGYLGYQQRFSIEDIEQEEREADSLTPPMLQPSELRVRIEMLMEKEQLYRQPNLKIVDLVRRMNSNRNYIYQAINREMGMSFNEYVNRLRVDYAARLIQQDPEKPLSAVSDLSGFTSNTSFYRNFRQFKGIAPKEFQNKMRIAKV